MFGLFFVLFFSVEAHHMCRLAGPAYFFPPLPSGIITNSDNGNPVHLVY